MIQRTCMLMFCVLLVFANVVFAEDNRPLVYIFAGQSNCDGGGRIEELEYEDLLVPENIELHIKTDRYSEATMQSYSDLNTFGPEFIFLRNLSRVFSDRKIIAIKYASFGGSMEAYSPRWAFNEPNPNWTGVRFWEMLNYVFSVVNGRNVAYRGVVWEQGEADALNDLTARAYRGNLNAMINGLRFQLGAPNLPFLFSTTNQSRTRYPGLNEVNQGKLDTANWYYRMAIISSLDLAKKKNDPIHYNTEGQLDLGYRYFNAYLPFLKADFGISTFATMD